MLYIREGREGRKNAKSISCVLPYSRYLRYFQTIAFFRFLPKGTGLLLAHTAVRNKLVMPATNSIGSNLNARSAARRAKGRRPGVTQASSVFGHWIPAKSMPE